MYYLKNLTAGTVINIGANQYTLLPGGELFLSNELYQIYVNELEAYVSKGILAVDIVPHFSVFKNRQPLIGVGQTLTPTEVLNGIVHRTTTSTLIADAFPTAAALLAAIPGATVGTSIDFYYSHATGGYSYVLLAAGAGMNFVDDFGYYSNAVEVRSGCLAHLLLYITSLNPPTFQIKVISNVGMLTAEEALADRFRIRLASLLSTAGDVIYTVQQLIGGMIVRDTAGSPRGDVSPTAASIVAFLGLPINGGVAVGSFVEFSIKNIGIAPNDINFTQGAGVTIYGGSPLAIPAASTANFLLIVTNVGSGTEAVTIYQK